jgi:hypothetical protein
MNQEFVSFVKRDDASITAYYAQGLVVVRPDPVRPGESVAARVSPPKECHFNEPWAPYARTVLVPLAIVVDIVTAPIQALVMMVVVSGLGGMH